MIDIDMTTSTRERIIRAAADLLAMGGRGGVSTRSVSAAAAVQPPTIYRQFGDMRGLLDAVSSYGFTTYIESKTTRERAEDPVEDLRRGWDLHVAFGLENPAIYTLVYGDPRPGSELTAAREAAELLERLVERVARAGRLRVSVERAAWIIQAAGVGVTLTLLAMPPDARDLSLSAMTRDAVLTAMTLGPSDQEPLDGSAGELVAHRAIALKAVLPDETGELTPGERAVLAEWLDRIIRSTP